MANNDKENKIKKFTKEAIGKTLNQFNKEIGIADLVEVNKNQDRILNGILSQVNDENTEKTEKSNIITLDNSTDGIVELKEIQGDTNVNVSKIEEMPITHDIGEKEGNVFTLNEIPKGAISIGEIQGNTMVNCNKDDEKELVLMKDLSTQGDNNITLTEGVDGGKVDVALEGNTLVNVSKTKDSTAITKSYIVENSGNHIALQGDIDGSCRPVITGNTLVNILQKIEPIDLNKTINTGTIPLVITNKLNTEYTMIINLSNLNLDNQSDIGLAIRGYLLDGTYFSTSLDSSRIKDNVIKLKWIETKNQFKNILIGISNSTNTNNPTFTLENVIILEGDYTNKTIPDYFEGLQSSFEDNLVTQEMVDSGEEIADNLGKYKVEYRVTGKNKVNQNLGVINSSYGGAKTVCFPVKPNTTYIYTSSKYKGNVAINEISEFIPHDTLASSIEGYLIKPNDISNNQHFTTSSRTKYIFMNYDKDSNIQVEEGDTATAYEPYKEYTKTLYLNSPLLEGDTIEEKDGGIYHVHRYRKSNLASVNWIKSDSYFYSNLNSNTSYVKENIVYCDKIPTVGYQSLDGMTSYGIALVGSFRVNLSNMNAQNNTLEEFRQWLIDNNPVVVYEMDSPTYELIEQQSNLVIQSYTNGHLDLASAVPVSKVNFLHFEEELTYLYPATSYTVQFNSDKATTADITLGGTKLLAQSIVAGLNRISITTPATLANNKLIIDGLGANISEVVVTDTDREFGYFEGMKSVGECENLEVKSDNKNLFDISLLKPVRNSLYGYYEFNPNGIAMTLSVTDKDPSVNISGLYIGFTGNGRNVNSGYEWVIGDGEFLAGKISRTTNMKYISFYPNTQSTLDKLFARFNFQLEEGDIATDYKPHQSNAQQLTHEPLRSIGEVKDRYVLIDGKWYIERKCGYRNSYSKCDDSWTHDTLTNKGLKLFKLDESIEAMDIPYAIRKAKSNKFKYVHYNYMDDRFNEPYLAYITADGHLWVSADENYTQQDMLNYINGCQFVYELQSPVYEPIDYNPLETYADITHISTNSAIPTNITVKNHGFNCLLKPSTTYTVSSNLGLNTVTTPSTLTEDCLRFMDTDTSDITTMRDVLILEGDWTTKANLIPANFSGIESAFEQELVTDENDEHYGKYKITAKVVGKNLFDKEDNWIKGQYLDAYDIIKFNDGAYYNPKYLKVNPNETYYSIHKDGTPMNISYLNFYDKNKNFIKMINDTTQFTIPSNVYYIRVTIWNVNIGDNGVIGENFIGNSTAYEPYKESSITFYIDEPLRGVEDSKDRIFIQDDKVVVKRNCGSVVFDGSDDEDIEGIYGSIYSNKCLYNAKISKLGVQGTNLKSNTLNTSKGATEYYDEGIYLFDNYIRFIINADRLNNIYTTKSFKQWLQQNPVKIVYQLAEPTYEEVEYSSNRLILNTFNNESFNNSTLFLDTNVSPKLSFKPLWEELVYVKSNTKYYIQFNAVGSGEVVINLGGTELTIEIVEGYNRIPITTPSESTNLMTIIGQGITISEVVVSEVICGGYYKGLQSCFEEHMENGKYRVLLRGMALDGSKVNGIKLYINEPLRGVDGVKDRLCIKNGKLMIERNYSSVILDGSRGGVSDTTIWGANNDKTIEFRLGFGLFNNKKEEVICDNFRSETLNLWVMDVEGIKSYETSTVDIRINKNRLSTPDVAGFKQWLQQNPVIVVYQLAEPVYEEATNEYGLPIVFEGYENGIVYIDSAVTPTTHIKYTSNNQLATTLSEAEEQNITTQEDINMNVITYMMDIDMMLTDMEMSNDISVMAVRRDNSNENMLDRMSDEDKKVYRDNTVVMLEKMITANVLDKEDIERRINMYYNKNRISKEQYKYLKSLL